MRHHHLPAISGIALLISLIVTAAAQAGENKVLWQIGKPDKSNAEFALAPRGYNSFREDGFFVVGQSDPKRDWPYVQPGPGDSWASSRAHSFVIVFGLKAAPAAGENCLLTIDLLDCQKPAPPRLRIDINGKIYVHNTTAGGGDDSVNGQPDKGKPHRIEIAFPADLLRAGANEIDINSIAGSWMLYDAITFKAPADAELAPVGGTIVHSMRSAPALIQKDGKLFQTVQISLRHFGEPKDAVVNVTGTQPMKIQLRGGPQVLDVPIAAVEKPTDIDVAVEVDGKKLAAQKQTLNPVRKWVIYFLPHSHNDIGYTHVQTDVEKSQWKYLDLALDTCQKTANYPAGSQFRWNVEVMWAVDSYLKQASPARRQQFIEAVKAGQIELDALYGNMLTGLCRPEEMVHLLDSAVAVSKEAGVPLESAMITDVPGYTWGLMSVLADAGVKYFSVGPNGGDRIGWTLAAWGDKPFWWIPPSGKGKVLTWVAGTGYGFFHGGTLKQKGEGPIFQYLNSLESRNYAYDLAQMRYSVGGDNGPPDPAMSEFVRDWNAKYAYPKLVIATTAQMCRDFEKKYGDAIPKVSGDFTPYWEDGAASSARETAINRESAERLVQTETLFAMLRPSAFPKDAFCTAWRNVILYDEHTWGAFNSISEPDKQFVKDQWKVKQAFALDGEKQAKALLASALGARKITGMIDVFNTCSWPRTDVVIVSKEMSAQGDLVRDGEGQKVPSQRLSTGELAFIAKDVPAFGARRYSIGKGAATAPDSRDAVSEESFGRGVDLETGIIGGSRLLLNDYIYLPGSDPKDAKRIGPFNIVSMRDKGPLVASLIFESDAPDAPGCNKLTRAVRVYGGLDRMDFIDTVDKKAVRTKEGVHFGFWFDLPNATVRMDTPWAIVRPEADQIPGACKNWFTIQRFIDVSNEKNGWTWAIIDAPLVEMGGLTANLIGSQSNPKAWIEHIKPSGQFYSWAMNNHWHTNYRADQEGPTVFRYSVQSHGKYDPVAAQKFGIERSQPLIVAPAADDDPPAPRLTLDNQNVIVTAFKPSNDGKAMIIRFFGASGKAEKVNLKFADPAPATIYLSDITEKQGETLTGPIDVPAYGIVTVRITK